MDEGLEYLRESPSFAYNTFMPQYKSRGYQYNQQPRPQIQPQYNAKINEYNQQPSTQPQFNGYNQQPSTQPQFNGYNQQPSTQLQFNGYNQQPSTQPQYNAQSNGKLYCTKAQKDHWRFKIRNSRFNI